jgi:hypothetical protein
MSMPAGRRLAALALSAVAIPMAMAGCGSSGESASTSEKPKVEVGGSVTDTAQEESEARHAARAAQRKQAKRHRIEQQEARQAEQQQTQTPAIEKGPPADWTSEEKQQFETNRVLCASEPQEQLASEWEVHNDAGSIAHAIGLEYRNRQDMQIAAEEGCLEALVGH